jgi:hypothetical protein
MSFGTLLTGNHRLSVRKREKLSPRNGQVDIDIVHGFSYWAYCSGTTYSTNTYVFRRKYTPNIYIYHPTKPWKRRRRMGSLKTMFPHRVPVASLSTCALNWRPLGALPPPVEGIKDCSNVWVIPPFLKALPLRSPFPKSSTSTLATTKGGEQIKLCHCDLSESHWDLSDRRGGGYDLMTLLLIE